MKMRFVHVCALLGSVLYLSGCSTNPATGEQQFTALMSPQQENQVGAQEHEKIIKQYGVYDDKGLQNYVNNIGSKVVKDTERPDVIYKFFLLDSPIINAFALPGGYIYITRGTLALSNSEAEMAAVLAHETGHITARHSAERYSRGVATSLGATILSAAIGKSGVSDALGMGANMYLQSYSRGQESQADSLGIRYLGRAGYNPTAMTAFLASLQADTELEAKLAGKKASTGVSYLSTHPATSERVDKTISESIQYANQGVMNRDSHLKKLDGMIYGDSASQGFVRENNFYHPEMGFAFSVPQDFKIVNQPSQIIATSQSGSGIVFDFVPNKEGLSPDRFLRDAVLQGNAPNAIDTMTVNGMRAATTVVSGTVNGKANNIRLVIIAWSNTQMARYQIGMPQNLPAASEKAIRDSIFTFRRMNASEKASLKPYHIKVITSKAGDSVASLSKRMAYKDYQQERFRVLNGLHGNQEVIANRMYKIIVE